MSSHPHIAALHEVTAEMDTQTRAAVEAHLLGALSTLVTRTQFNDALNRALQFAGTR